MGFRKASIVGPDDKPLAHLSTSHGAILLVVTILICFRQSLQYWSGEQCGCGCHRLRGDIFLSFLLSGYGGLGLSIEGPSKVDINCEDMEDGTCKVTYCPTEPGTYIINIKFADKHVPGEAPSGLGLAGGQIW